MNNQKIVHSYSFYHTDRHNPLNVFKTVAVIYEHKSFLKSPVYTAELCGVVEKDGLVKTRPLGDSTNNRKEFADLLELKNHIEEWANTFYKDAVENGCVQVISALKVDEPDPLKFACPKYTPDDSIRHDDKLDQVLDGLDLKDLLKLKEGIVSGDLGSMLKKLGDVMKNKGTNQGVIVVNGKTNKVESINIGGEDIPIKQNIPDEEKPKEESAIFSKKIEDVKEVSEEEYQALCKKYGKKKIDALKKELANKNVQNEAQKNGTV